MTLSAGGAPSILVRDIGTANAVQGQQAFGSTIQGGYLTSSLPNIVLMQAGDGFSSFSLSEIINAIRYGTFTPNRFYLGSSQVSKIYLGTSIIYSLN